MCEMQVGDMKKYLCVSLLLALMSVGYVVSAVAAGRAASAAKNVKVVEEKPAGETPADLEHGKEIFQSICSHCHRIDYEASAVGAPGLRDVMDRHTPEWQNQWLANPAGFAKKDKTAKALIKANPYGLTMPTLPEMQNSQSRKDVIEFLKTLKGE